MLHKIAITAALGAAVVGGGTAAMASSAHTPATNNPTAAGAPASTSSTSTTKPARKHSRGTHLGRALHATWVTENARTGAVRTHDAIHGTVSSVSPTAITLRAADGVSQTYRVTSATKVVHRTTIARPTPAQGTPGRRAQPSSIGAIKIGDHAVVVGVGTGTLTAKRIVDGLKN